MFGSVNPIFTRFVHDMCAEIGRLVPNVAGFNFCGRSLSQQLTALRNSGITYQQVSASVEIREILGLMMALGPRDRFGEFRNEFLQATVSDSSEGEDHGANAGLERMG